MVDPGVVGMITGIIGALSGIAGLVVSVKNYRRVSAIKALDLRIELQRAFNDLDLLRKGIEEFLDSVNQSHERVMSARGLLSGGAGEIWKKEFADDKATLRRLLGIAPRAQGQFEKLSPFELEAQLILVHRSSGELKGVRGKYQGILENDDKWRLMREQQMRS